MPNRVAKYPKPKECPYCSSDIVYTSNKEIYGKEFGSGKCYKCTKCDAYVGVHKGTDIPLGRMANKELRDLKKRAHALFDPIWQNGKKKRSQAYSDLAKKLGIKADECHFGWFDKEMLERSISILSPKTPKKNINPKVLILESVELLRKDSSLTEQWGIEFIQSLIHFINDGKELTDKQLTCLKKQHDTVMKNAKIKGIVK
jgi:hypothetical protein